MKYKNVKIYEPTNIKKNVQIGEGTTIGEFCVIGANARIGKNCRILYQTSICKDAVIGDNCFLGPKVALLNDKKPPSKISEPPIIGNNVVLGACCIVMPRIKIGNNVVVGAGTIITKDIPDNQIIYDKREKVYI